MIRPALLAILSLAMLGASDLPDLKLTPGATVSVSLKTLCLKGYATSVRSVRSSVKRAVYAEYGVKSHKLGQFEIDHLVSLELSGSNDRANLWPQSYSGEWNAHVKDALEDRLHALVCSGQISLAAAQQDIRVDWIAAYKKVFKTDKP